MSPVVEDLDFTIGIAGVNGMVFRENWFPELRELGRQDFSVLRQNTP